MGTHYTSLDLRTTNKERNMIKRLLAYAGVGVVIAVVVQVAAGDVSKPVRIATAAVGALIAMGIEYGRLQDRQRRETGGAR